MRTIAVSALVLAVAACGNILSPTGQPDRLTGTVYVERTYQGMPLPFGPPAGDTSAVKSYLVADTVSFNGYGTLANIAVDSTVYADSVPPRAIVQRFVAALQYAIRGDSVVVQPVCGPGELCVVPPTFHIEGDTALLRTYANTPQKPPDLFVRVR